MNSSDQTRDLFHLSDVQGIVAEAAHRTKPTEIGMTALVSMTTALNACAAEYIDFLLQEPEATRIADYMSKITDVATALADLVHFSVRPNQTPWHGTRAQIAKRAEARAQSLRRALAHTAGSGSVDRGLAELRGAVRDLDKVLDSLITWATATEDKYSQSLERIRTQFVGVRRKGDHRPTGLRALEIFVFKALQTYQQNIDRPGTAERNGSPDSPAIRYLDAVFRLLRNKVTRTPDLVAIETGNILSPDRTSLSNLIRKYNQIKKGRASGNL